ncbi:hypothetical protein [Streptomyces sp. NPDC002889]
MAEIDRANALHQEGAADTAGGSGASRPGTPRSPERECLIT